MIARRKAVAEEDAVLHCGVTFAKFVLGHGGLEVYATAERNETGAPVGTVTSVPGEEPAASNFVFS